MYRYNKKEFLCPNSIRTMACYHAKIKQDNIAMFSIHDCNIGIRLWNDLNSDEEKQEMIDKLRALATGANDFANYLDSLNEKDNTETIPLPL